jgi:uncharacterized protein (DUF1330 family)
MSVYCIGHATLTNKQAFAQYREKSTAALKKYNGAVVAASPNVETIEGTPQHSSIAIILSFPSEEDARNWRSDPELSTTHGLRQASGEWSIQLLAAPK